jgi:hypothetical protein
MASKRRMKNLTPYKVAFHGIVFPAVSANEEVGIPDDWDDATVAAAQLPMLILVGKEELAGYVPIEEAYPTVAAVNREVQRREQEDETPSEQEESLPAPAPRGRRR